MKKKFLEYLIILMVIMCSGAVIINQDKIYLPFHIITILLLLTYIFIKKLKIGKVILSIFVIITIILFYCFIHVVVLNSSFSNEYLGLILKLIIPCMTVYSFKRKEFEDKFVKIMFILAIISLINHFYGLLNIKYILNRPVIITRDGIRYYNGIVHIWLYDKYLFIRNCGIFWEPGAYQAVLNLALFINLCKKIRKINTMNVIFLIAIITTLSTSGFIIMLLIFAVFLVNIRYIFFSVMTIGILSYGLMQTQLFHNIVVQKISNSDNASTNRRKADISADLDLFMENPVLGIGYFKYKEDFIKVLRTKNTTELGYVSSNSITFLLACFGLLFSLFLFAGYIGYCYIFSKNFKVRISFIIILIMIFIPENFLLRPFFLTLFFYGISAMKIRQRAGGEKNAVNNNSYIQ